MIRSLQNCYFEISNFQNFQNFDFGEKLDFYFKYLCNRRLPVSARNRHQPRRSLPPALISESPVSWSRRQLLRNTGGRGVRGAGIESLHLCFDAGVLVM